MKSYLFVGGESDGKWMGTTGSERYEMAMRRSSQQITNEILDDRLPVLLPFRHQTYTIRRWSASERIFAFYALESMDDASVFERLLRGYHQKGN